MVAEGSTWKTPSGEVLRLREVTLRKSSLVLDFWCIPQGLYRYFSAHQVWQDNLEEELVLIRDVIEDYPYLAMGKTSLHNLHAVKRKH